MTINSALKIPRFLIVGLILALGLVAGTAYIFLHPGPTVRSAALNATAIAAGGYDSLVLLNNGTVVAWGGGLIGNCGSTSILRLHNVTAIAAGDAHNLALKNDGIVIVWGDNTHDQCNVSAITGLC